MTSRFLPSRQWNLCRTSSFAGAARKKGWLGAAGSAVSSSSSSLSWSVPSIPHRSNNCRPPTDCRATVGPRPCTFSTAATSHVPPNRNSRSQQQLKQQPNKEGRQQQQRRPRHQSPPPPPSPPSLARVPPEDRNDNRNHGSQRKTQKNHMAALKVRSQHLEDVAFGKVADDAVRMADYQTAFEEWMALARSQGGAGMGQTGSSLTSSGGLEAARRARSLLLALEHNVNPHLAISSAPWRPTVPFHNLVLQVYAVCGGGAVAAREAQALLEHMLEKARAATQPVLPPRRTPHCPEPKVASYNIVLNCWARARCNDAGIRAEEVFDRMEEWRRECHAALQRDPSFPYRGCYPTAITVSTLIYALTTSKSLHAPDRSWQLLQEIVEALRNPTIPKHRFHKVRLDPRLFNVVIFSWTRSGRGRDAAAKAEEILSLAGTIQAEGLMENVPCERTYALVLDAWAKCEDSTGECAERAHNLLFKMIRLYRQGAPIEINFVAFGTCIAAWSRCANLQDAPEKAESILQELLSLYDETGLVDFHLELSVWHSLQAVWLNATERTESMDRGAEIIQRMQKHGCQPSIVSYFQVLHAAGRRGLGDQALALLGQYVHDPNIPLHREGRMFNAVLEALARESREDAMDRATVFFEKMKYQNNYAKPDVYSYSILMGALSRTEGSRHAERGRDLLEQMLQRFQQGDETCRPDPHNIAVALKLCSNTSGTDADRRQALDIATEIFCKCKSHFGVSPNEYVYNAMLQAIKYLAASNDQRLVLLEKVFEECRATGHVSAVTLTIMRRGGAVHCLSGLTAFSSRLVPPQDRPDTTLSGLENEFRPDGSPATALCG